METSKKILIVEDEKPMTHALELKLGREGYQVETVADGETAVQKILEGGFDLILLDLVIPKKDGFSVLKEIHARGSLTPVIVTSNLSQEEDEKKAKELGAVNYIIKSNTSISKIVEEVNRFFA